MYSLRAKQLRGMHLLGSHCRRLVADAGEDAADTVRGRRQQIYQSLPQR